MMVLVMMISVMMVMRIFFIFQRRGVGLGLELLIVLIYNNDSADDYRNRKYDSANDQNRLIIVIA